MTTEKFGEQWITDYFAMVDRMDLKEFVTWYNDDGSFMFANNPPAKGKEAVSAALGQFYALIDSMHHEKTGIWVSGDTGVWEARVHFKTKTGKELILPAASVLRLKNGKVEDFRMYMDANPILHPDQ